jgi:hypothetical protein
MQREPRFTPQGEARPLIPGFRMADLMHKFSSRTMLIFIVSLLVAVILLGLGTAYISKLKQQRRQLSDNSLFDCGALAAPLGLANVSASRICRGGPGLSLPSRQAAMLR